MMNMSVRPHPSLALLVSVGFLGLTLGQKLNAAENGTIHVPAFDLPRSDLLSDESRAVLERQAKERALFRQTCPLDAWGDAEQALAYRKCADEHQILPLIAKQRAHYKVTIQPETIAGVRTEVLLPADGISAANRHRVLINLHGGGFFMGGGQGVQVTSIPIAAVGKIKVVSVDYRMWPEHQFPAASEDAAKVYSALLKEYQPENIGIFGCSAGGILTAEAIAWFQKVGLPRPGAVGIFCAGATNIGGESLYIGAAMAGLGPPSSKQKMGYFTEADLNNPLAFPALDPQVLAQFPPSLLISGTRDNWLSPVLVTHAQLVKFGVDARLHVWEAMDHAFFFEPDLPESREAYEVIARFFDQQLGRRLEGNGS